MIDLSRLMPGDFVTTGGETRIVHRLEPPSGAWLSTAGPMSTNGKGKFLNWGALTAVRELMDANTQIHQQGDDGYEQLAAWYYLQ